MQRFHHSPFGMLPSENGAYVEASLAIECHDICKAALWVLESWRRYHGEAWSTSDAELHQRLLRVTRDQAVTEAAR